MPPGDKTKSIETLQAEVARLREIVENAPRLHRKDVMQMLGISARTMDRRVNDPKFPKPIYDAGRPKWMPSQFAGFQAGH